MNWHCLQYRKIKRGAGGSHGGTSQEVPKKQGLRETGPAEMPGLPPGRGWEGQQRVLSDCHFLSLRTMSEWLEQQSESPLWNGLCLAASWSHLEDLAVRAEERAVQRFLPCCHNAFSCMTTLFQYVKITWGKAVRW